MGSRGKQSAQELLIAQSGHGVVQSYPDAPYDLDDAEADEWRAIVAAMPPDYFARTHQAMLSQLCKHIIASRRIAQMISIECRKKKFNRVEYSALLDMQNKESMAIMRLCRTMRLTQLSIWPTASKKLRPVPRNSDAPWKTADDNDESD
jgi:hypothetical protein